MIELAAGEQRELNIALVPTGVVAEIEAFPYFIAHQGWPAVPGADARIYLALTNNGASPITLTCTAFMRLAGYNPASRSETFTIEAGASYKFRKEIHGNYGDDVDCWIEIEMPDGRLITLPTIQCVLGYTLTSQDPPELVATEIGNDYVVLRFAEPGSRKVWQFGVRTPIVRPYEQRIDFECRSNESNMSIYAYIGNLLSGRTYKAKCEGCDTQFTTP